LSPRQDTIIKKSLKELSSYDSRNAEWRAAASIHSSEATLKYLAEKNDLGIYPLLAGHPNITRPILKYILQETARRGYRGLPETVATNPAVPKEWFEKYGWYQKYISDLSINSYDRWKLLRSEDVAEEILQDFANKLHLESGTSYRETCRLIIYNPSSNLNILETVSQKISEIEPKLDRELISYLYCRIARIPEVSLERLQELLKECSSDLMLKQAIMEHVEGDKLLLPLFLKQPQSLIYWFTLHHHRLSETKLRNLFNEMQPWKYRYAIAQNPSTPKDLLETMAQDEHPYVQAAARSALGLEIITSSAIAATSEPVTPEKLPTPEVSPVALNIKRSITLLPEDRRWTVWLEHKSVAKPENYPHDRIQALSILVTKLRVNRNHDLSTITLEDILPNILREAHQQQMSDFVPDIITALHVAFGFTDLFLTFVSISQWNETKCVELMRLEQSAL
jgi:hypothetical protein